MPPHDEERGPRQVSTWLVIPYVDGDLGRKGFERPIDESQVPSWLCPSILVNGEPGGTAFKRGEPFDVEIRVANWGAGALPAPVLVRLWWCDPTLAFATATLLFQVSRPILPTGVPQGIGPFSVTIPVGASPHVCLLAQVSAPIDGAPAVPDPANDRHWAQHNLVEFAAVAGEATFLLPVAIANPFDLPARTALSISAMPATATRRLSAHQDRDIIPGEGAELQVDLAEDEVLPPGATREVLVTIRTLPPAPGAAVGVVLKQAVWVPDGEERRVEGSLGVLLTE